MNSTTWQDWYAEASRALDDLLTTCDEVFVAGLSMGGCLSLRLAEERPDDVSGLMLVNPSVTSINKQLYAVPVLKRLVGSIKGIANDIKKPGTDEYGYDRVPLKALDSLRDLWKVTRDDLPKVTAPLVLFRSADRPRGRARVGSAHHSARLVARRHRAHPRRQLPRRHARQRRAANLRGVRGVHRQALSARPAAHEPADSLMRSNGLTAATYTPVADLESSARRRAAGRSQRTRCRGLHQAGRVLDRSRFRPSRVPRRSQGPAVRRHCRLRRCA